MIASLRWHDQASKVFLAAATLRVAGSLQAQSGLEPADVVLVLQARTEAADLASTDEEWEGQRRGRRVLVSSANGYRLLVQALTRSG